MPARWSRARCCWRTCGTTTSTPRPTSSTCIFPDCALRSTRDSPSRFCTPCVARDTWFVTALGQLLRTTAFRLTLVYLLVFALFAAFLLAYFALNTRRLITEQISSTIDAEITGLSEQYNRGGIRLLVLVIEG